MEKMNDLRDLLKHEVEDLYSAEEQIIDALPAMIEKASNTALKKSLTEHLRVTEQQKQRLDQVLQLLSGGNPEENGSKKKKFLGIFEVGGQKCKGMEGIIGEGKKMMSVDMDPDVMDAALIACAQKVEHYEICGYGTARSYATELELHQVASLLEETLNEEYDADDKLTFLAESRINKQAERMGGRMESRGGRTKVARQGGQKERETERERERERELEPVSSRRQKSEGKTEGKSERGGRPKASSTPRSSAGRSSQGSSSRTTASKSKSSSRSNESGRSSKGRGSSSSRNR
jgi:ferritin-like metal-binding protein YciE